MYVQKNKAHYFLAWRHQTTTKRCSLCRSDLGDSCEFAYD